MNNRDGELPKLFRLCVIFFVAPVASIYCQHTTFDMDNACVQNSILVTNSKLYSRTRALQYGSTYACRIGTRPLLHITCSSTTTTTTTTRLHRTLLSAWIWICEESNQQQKTQSDLERDRKTASMQSICLQSEKENFARCLNLSFSLLSPSLFFPYNSTIHHPFPASPTDLSSVCVCVPLFDCFPTISPHARTLRGRTAKINLLLCCCS